LRGRHFVQLKRERPSSGASKIREKLRRLHSEIPTPCSGYGSASTSSALSPAIRDRMAAMSACT